MDELSPTARRVLMAARADAEPTAADRLRVQGLLVAAIAAPASTAAAASAATTKAGATAVGTGLFAQWNVAVFATALALGGGGYMAYVWNQSPRATSAVATPATAAPEASSPEAVQATTTAPVETVAPAADARDADAPATARAARAVRRHAATPSTHVAQEVAWIARAEAALEQGSPTAALRALKEHADQFPAGELQQERLGLRAVALCSLPREPSAAAAGRAFVTRYPDSMLAQRVHAVCADSMHRGAE